MRRSKVRTIFSILGSKMLQSDSFYSFSVYIQFFNVLECIKAKISAGKQFIDHLRLKRGAMFDLGNNVWGIVRKTKFQRLGFGKIVSKRRKMHTVANTYQTGRSRPMFRCQCSREVKMVEKNSKTSAFERSKEGTKGQTFLSILLERKVRFSTSF